MSVNASQDLNIYNIIKNFCIDGEFMPPKKFGSGHINDSFLIRNKSRLGQDYLLQKINHHVFKDVSGVINNIKVTAHLKNKMSEQIGDKVDDRVLSLIPARDRQFFIKDEAGDYWRMYLFIRDSKSYDIVTSEKQAYEGGKALGNFHCLLSDMDPALLSETIVDFHNIQKRLKDLYFAIDKNEFSRKPVVEEEIAFIKDRESTMSAIYNWGQAGLLPKRIIHNDTKFNNILFDQDDKVQCIVDLDTVMSGYIAYDFGDAVRTLINSTTEDEPDLKKTELKISRFKAYTEGYLRETDQFLTDKEKESLSLGVLLFPYMQGVRFLTDYLQGDTYFKTAYPEHNLVRTKTQFELLKKLRIISV